MSWEILVETIASEIGAELRREAQGEVRELSAAEEASVTIHDRLRGSVGRFVTIRTRGSRDGSGCGYTLNGTLRACGGDWVILESVSGFTIVPERSIVEVSGLGTALVAEERFPIPLNALLRRLVGTSTTITIGDERLPARICSVGADYLAVTRENRSRNATRYSLDDRNIPTGEVLLPLEAVDFLTGGDMAEIKY